MDSQKKEGNKGFSVYYDRLASRVYDFVCYRVSHKQTAEDLTSEIFLKAFRNWQEGQSDAWIFAIARNRVIDHYRSHRDIADIESIFDLRGNDDIERDVDSRRKLEKIKSQLSCLTSFQRQIVIMRVWDELSYQEISEILGKNEGAIKMAFSRAVSTLKDSVGPLAVIAMLLAK
jgi:RNA polymerase sigma-70 factor (ECF subfamily)